jgi:ABC-type spermidine/putrescine transport system permease subunit I
LYGHEVSQYANAEVPNAQKRRIAFKKTSHRDILTRNAPQSPTASRPFNFQQIILLLITALVLLYGVIYPNLSVVITSLQQDDHWTLANYRAVLTQPNVLEAIFNIIDGAVVCAGRSSAGIFV